MLPIRIEGSLHSGKSCMSSLFEAFAAMSINALAMEEHLWHKHCGRLLLTMVHD